jgi:hypothetical protein
MKENEIEGHVKGMGEASTANEILQENMTRRDPLGDLGIDKRMILR